jgi:hypothetical protein
MMPYAGLGRGLGTIYGNAVRFVLGCPTVLTAITD